jgi:Dullard-like phosphatase family protein
MTSSDKPLKKRLLAHLRNQGNVQTSRDPSYTKKEEEGVMGKSASFNSLGMARGEREKWGYLEKDGKVGSGCETIDSPRSLAYFPKASKSHPPSPRGSIPELPPLRPITGSSGHLAPKSPPHHSPKKKPFLTSPTALTSFVTQSKPQMEKAERLERKHALSVLQGLRFGRSLPAVDQGTLIMKRVALARKPGCSGRKTLIFDLDETLIHCCSDLSQADVKLPVILPTQQITTAGINIRPYAHDCLSAASRLFEVIVFTASQRVYADTVLDYLDPTHSLIHHRLYRENCIPVKGMYVKDLRLLAGRELKDIILVDNTVISFINQLDNGIPIPTWTNDPSDCELLHLISFFPALLQAADVRSVLSSTFHLRDILSDLESYHTD